MSYAIETKKRKFDRILEALTDGASSASPSSLTSRSHASTTALSQDTASGSSKRRRITPVSKSASPASSAITALSGHYLPSSRVAFLQRLETFRDVTKWHVPSTDPINAAAWAKRGWTCVDTDTVCCGTCKERLHIDLSLDDELLETRQKDDGQEQRESAEKEDSFALSSEIYDTIVGRYQDMIITAHTESCLWRKRGCDSSIQRIEGLLNTTSAISGLKARYESIMERPDELSQVESLPSTPIVDSHELERFRFRAETPPDVNALKLAICGWERKCDEVIECRHCFRSLGLWLYRGDSPAIEKMDAVGNHLEYCPWRSTETQDTEALTGHRRTGSSDDSSPKKARVAGWVLVYQAMTKDNSKRRGATFSGCSANSEADLSTGSLDSTTPELRERKLRDLLRRIKEIKKPFNVKALLKRKDKSIS